MSIADRPRFAWRGFMLDVARHFFGVADVCRVIDHLAAYKLNVLHLHLSDDQGWRIAIDAWPRLTEHGGFYSHDDLRAIVRYAAERHITVVPEIDAPGHVQAAIAAYPELGVPGSSTERYFGTDVGFSSLDVHSDADVPLPRRRLRRAGRADAGAVPARRRRRGAQHVARGLPRVHGARAAARRQARQAARSAGRRSRRPRSRTAPSCSTGTTAELARRGGGAGRAARDVARRPCLPRHEVRRRTRRSGWTGRATSSCATATSGTRPSWSRRARRRSSASRRRSGPRRSTTLEELETMLLPRLCAVAEVGWSPRSARDWDGLPRARRRGGRALGRRRRRLPPLAAGRLALSFIPRSSAAWDACPQVRVLIVEDEVKLAGIVRRGMRERGLRADVATRGEDALWMAARPSTPRSCST